MDNQRDRPSDVTETHQKPLAIFWVSEASSFSPDPAHKTPYKLSGFAS